MIIQKKIDNLEINVSSSTAEMGEAAAGFVAQQVQRSIESQGFSRMILATGASQFAFLQALKEKHTIDWGKVTVFHLDEYLGMSDQHPASFRKYLKERILDTVQPGQIHLLNGDSEQVEDEMNSYSKLLLEAPIDIACIGIGENGHIAFNDPPVADFNDPLWVKIVDLDEDCRNQQLGEGWFGSLTEVPTQAVSLTIPAIMRSQVISCVVPDERKAAAVEGTLYSPVSEACPATILRTHPRSVLWLDNNSARGLKN